jgi:hypothetical protein
MIKLQMITTTENWGRPAETTAWGYIDPAAIQALIPLRSRQIDGEYIHITQIVLADSVSIEVAGTPDEVKELTTVRYLQGMG